MKIMAKVLLVVALGASLLQGAAFEKIAKTKAAKVLVSSEKPVTTGYNTFNISLDDAKLKDSAVRMKVFMPAMPGMPYMDNIADAKNLGNGKYEAVVNFSMGGTWQIQIFITPKNGKKIKAKTSLNI